MTDMPLVTSFSDVPAGHTFCDAITWAAGQGVVGGYADGSFKPANSVTKAQFCVMLSRAFYPDEIAKYANPEGSKLAWFAPNATALYYAKVLPGTSFAHTVKKCPLASPREASQGTFHLHCLSCARVTLRRNI